MAGVSEGFWRRTMLAIAWLCNFERPVKEAHGGRGYQDIARPTSLSLLTTSTLESSSLGLAWPGMASRPRPRPHTHHLASNPLHSYTALIIQRPASYLVSETFNAPLPKHASWAPGLTCSPPRGRIPQLDRPYSCLSESPTGCPR